MMCICMYEKLSGMGGIVELWCIIWVMNLRWNPVAISYRNAPRGSPGIMSPSGGHICIKSTYAFTSYVLRRDSEIEINVRDSALPSLRLSRRIVKNSYTPGDRPPNHWLRGIDFASVPQRRTPRKNIESIEMKALDWDPKGNRGRKDRQIWRRTVIEEIK